MSGDFVVFPQSVGWGVVIGVSIAFAALMWFVSYVLEKYNGEVQTSEMLMTGNRAVKTGLIASAVVSSWTIGSTLLLSCTSAYNLGVSGPWWYGGGACVQIIMFCTAAVEIKRRAPNAHTYQELVRVRYGKTTHLLTCFYSLFQQVCYATNLLINGSSIISNLTGINRDASIVLLPLFVALFTIRGGLKSTFISDWIHCVIIYIVMMMFAFNVFATNDKIGSPGALYDLLTIASEKYPVPKNLHGSLLTMTSVNGGLFGLVLLGAGFAASADPALLQKALAADKNHVLMGYILGGLAWFSLPFVLATTLGLACRGLEITEHFPTYPERLSQQQINDGLVMPIAAYTLMGKTGAGGVITLIFLACTAAFSAETVASSALVTHDFYKAYWYPNATGKELVKVARYSITAFFVVCSGLGIGLAHAGFDVSFITTVSGIVVNVCVAPIAFTLFWKRMSPLAYILGTTLSTCIALAVWFGYAVSESGYIDLVTLSTYGALAAGNVVAVGTPLLIVPIVVWIKPSNFDWEIWRTEIKQADDAEINEDHGITNVLSNEELTYATLDDEKKNEKFLLRQRNIGLILTAIFVSFFLLVFPMPLYGSHYIFSRKFFTGWVVVMFLWAFFSTSVITLLPVWDARHSIKGIFKKFVSRHEGSISEVEVLESKSDNLTLGSNSNLETKHEETTKVKELDA